MTRYSARPVRELYQLAGSTAPVPGDGVVTALTAMLGVGLVLKSIRITLKHADLPALRAAEPRLEAIAAAFEADADEDARAFSGFIAAGRLPRATAEQAAVRARRHDEAAAASARAALDTLAHANAAVRAARRVRGVIAPVMAPDMAAGLRLLHVVRRNAVENARGNLEEMSASPEHARLVRALQRLSAA